MHVGEAVVRGGRLGLAHLLGKSLPLHVSLYVTTRCNLRCVYCSSPHQRESELSAEEWCGVLDQLHRLGTERVTLFGGEPLVRPDLAPIVARARRLGLHMVLVSNGTQVPSCQDVVSQVHTLVLSVDGPKPAHDANRGVGSFEDVLRAIDLARSWNVQVKLNAVLNANTVQHLDWLLEFAASEHLPLTVNLMRSGSTGLWKDASQHRAADECVRTALAHLIAAKRTNRWIVFSAASYELARRWPDYTRDRLSLQDVNGRFAGPACSAGRFHCVIYADGCLYPCGLTVRQLSALNVRYHGVAAALAHARHHGCAACTSVCMLEINGLFALNPRVVASLARSYLTSRLA